MRRVVMATLVLALVAAGGCEVGREMPPCEHEDSINCVWDAQSRSNGRGQSFVDIDGVKYATEGAGR